MWGQLSLETMQAAREIDFRFFFPLGATPCYLWIAPEGFRKARLAAGLFYFFKYNTSCEWQIATAICLGFREGRSSIPIRPESWTGLRSLAMSQCWATREDQFN